MARPFVVRVGDLLREPGSRRAVADAADLSPVEISSARTIPGTDQTLDAEVMAMAGGVEITGAVGFDWWGECRRCLEDVHGHVDVELREVAQREPVDEDVYRIDGDLLDLEPMVRELVLAHLPLAPLCGPDCPGPDPERFPTTTEDEVEAAATEAPPAPDPRWAALGDLSFE